MRLGRLATLWWKSATDTDCSEIEGDICSTQSHHVHEVALTVGWPLRAGHCLVGRSSVEHVAVEKCDTSFSVSRIAWPILVQHPIEIPLKPPLSSYRCRSVEAVVSASENLHEEIRIAGYFWPRRSTQLIFLGQISLIYDFTGHNSFLIVGGGGLKRHFTQPGTKCAQGGIKFPNWQ